MLFFLVVPVCAILGFEATRQTLLRLSRASGASVLPAPAVTYTAAAVTGVVAAVLIDVFVLRSRVVLGRVFWCTYPIVFGFQLLSNGILTGRGVVLYNPADILGLRLVYAPSRTSRSASRSSS